MNEKLAFQFHASQSGFASAPADGEDSRPTPAVPLITDSSFGAEADGPTAKPQSPEEEVQSLRARLAAEIRAHQLAQEKILQLQREMSCYRQSADNPGALRDSEKHLAKRVAELVIAQEQVHSLTQELRAARAANSLQNERMDKLHYFASEMKRKGDVLAADLRASIQERSQLVAKLNKERARRKAAEAELAGVQGKPAASPEPTASQLMDAESMAELRGEIQAAMKAAAPHLFAPHAPSQPLVAQNARGANLAHRK